MIPEQFAMRRRMMGKSDNRTWLYNKGDECVNITGGWQARGVLWHPIYTVKAPTIIKNADNMQASLVGTATQSGVLEIVQNIDLTQYNTLTAHICSASVNTTSQILTMQFAAYPRNTTSLYNTMSAHNEFIISGGGRPSSVSDVLIDVGVSGVQGSYDIGFILTVQSGVTAQLVVDSIYLQ